jgi:hypothetical protein
MIRRAEGALGVYAGGESCASIDPNGIDAVDAEFKALQKAFDRTTCARQSTDGQLYDTGDKMYQTVRVLSHRLTVTQVHMIAERALIDATKALADAKKAKNTDEAKTAAKAATEQAKAARAALAIAADDCTRKKVAAVETTADLAQEQVELRESAPSTMCGADSLGLPRRSCGVYGISAAALSFLWSADGNGLRAGRRLTSVGVPAVAFRVALTNWVALDLGGYSAFITKSLASTSPSVDRVACSRSPTEFENRLPCEASNEMYAYGGVYAGFTLGRSGIGFLTIAPATAGLAQLGSRTTLVPYVGFSVGALQLNGNF